MLVRFIETVLFLAAMIGLFFTIAIGALLFADPVWVYRPGNLSMVAVGSAVAVLLFTVAILCTKRG